MRSVRLAELAIRLFTSRERAAALMGDLLETRSQRGAVWFWFSIARVMFSLGWRLLGGVAAAWFMGMAWLNILQKPISVSAPHVLPAVWERMFLGIDGVGILLWFIAPYAFFRFGFRDRFTALANLFAWSITSGLYFWWIPGMIVVCSCVVVAGCIWALISREWRRAFVSLVCTTAGSLVAGLGLLYVEGIWQMRVYGPLVAEMHSPVPGMFVDAFVLATCAICSTAHRFCVVDHRYLAD